MSDKQVITKEKEEALALRWLQMPVTAHYEGMLVDAIEVFATDGYRVHRAPVPEPLRNIEPGSVLRIRDGKKLHKTAGRVYDAETRDVNYPQEITTFGPKGPPTVTFAINRDYLIDALEMPTNPLGVVHISVWGRMDPVRVESADGDFQALVMPMDLEQEEPEESRLPRLIEACRAAQEAIDLGENKPLSLEEEKALELIEEALS